MKTEHFRDFIKYCNADDHKNIYKSLWLDGELFEVRKYKEGVIHGYQRLHLRNTETKSTKIKSEENSYYRSLKAIRTLVEQNFTVNHYFLTLTFDPQQFPWIYEKQGFENIPYYWKLFTQKHFDRYLKKQGLKYIAIPEYIAKGTNHWHIHVLLNKKPTLGLSKEEFVKSMQDLTDNWGCGRTQLSKLSSFSYFKYTPQIPNTAQKLVAYITKYLLKNIEADVFPKGKKRYFTSRNLIKPEIYYSDINPVSLKTMPKEPLITSREYNWEHTGVVEVTKINKSVPWYYKLKRQYLDVVDTSQL